MNIPAFLRLLLWPLSLLYGAAARLRVWLYARGWMRQKRLNAIVISVGNLTVGGTGKTPMAMWLAECFLARGKRVAILSRGYRGSMETSDEVELMKRRLGDRVSFGVGKDRYIEGKRFEAKGIDVFLLDDGFQHLQLARDLDIVLVDKSRAHLQEWLLPAGRLREPTSALNRADIVVMTRAGACESVEASDSHQYRIFYAHTRLLGFRLWPGSGECYVSELGARPFFAFCGIGNPHAFFEDLRRWHVAVAGTRCFPDHHRYSACDVQEIEKAAIVAGASALVTTEKDACNLGAARFSKLRVYVAAIHMEPNSESEFFAAAEQIVSSRGKALT